MVCCVKKLLLTVADVEATSLLPSFTSGRVWYSTGNIPKYAGHREYGCCGQSLQYENGMTAFNSEEFWQKKVSIFSFSTQKLFLAFPQHREAAKLIHFIHLKLLPWAVSLCSALRWDALSSKLSYGIGHILSGFWNQLCEHTTRIDLWPWLSSPLCSGSHYLKLEIQNELYGQQTGKNLQLKWFKAMSVTIMVKAMTM